MQRVFRAFDEDGSGSLDTEEIEQVMCSFNITPFRSTVEATSKDMILLRKVLCDLCIFMFHGLSCPVVVALHTFPVVSYLGVSENVVGLSFVATATMCAILCLERKRN